MVVAAFLLFFLGADGLLLDTFVQSIGGYLANIIPLSFRTASYGDLAFVSGWTVFYWAWWIFWASFVGTFIARISKGRTIREFVVGVILVPSVASFVWFAILGGTPIDLQLSGTADIASPVSAGNRSRVPFLTLRSSHCSGSRR